MSNLAKNWLKYRIRSIRRRSSSRLVAALAPMVAQKGHFRAEAHAQCGCSRGPSVKSGIERQRAIVCYCEVVVVATGGQERDALAFSGEEWY